MDCKRLYVYTSISFSKTKTTLLSNYDAVFIQVQILHYTIRLQTFENIFTHIYIYIYTGALVLSGLLA